MCENEINSIMPVHPHIDCLFLPMSKCAFGQQGAINFRHFEFEFHFGQHVDFSDTWNNVT